MRYWLVICFFLCTHHALAQPLRIGVLPYLSPRSLLLELSPLRQFLAVQLKRDVEILTARDFPGFLTRTRAGDFDVIITAPHFARLAQTTQGYLPLIAIRADFYALLLVPKDSPAASVRALKKKTLHLPHRLSFVSLQIEDFLRKLGLNPERDFQFKYYSTDNNAILATEQSSDDAGATQRTVFEGMPSEISRHLRVLGSTQSALSLIILAHPRIEKNTLAALQAALLAFPYSEAGLHFFQSGHSEFVPADEATMEKLDIYSQRLQLRLEQVP